MELRDFHRTSALVVGMYALMHVTNHLASLCSIPTHLAFMEVARAVYRQWIIERVLLFCVAFQILSGLWLFLRGWKERRGTIPWLQAGSGAYLAFFLVVHVAAVLFGRSVLKLDTNFYYAAAGLHVAPYPLFFAPYYFLAVLALFTHLGCAAYWQWQASARHARAALVIVPMLLGGVVSLLIVLSLAGKLQPFEIPAKYTATYLGHQ